MTLMLIIIMTSVILLSVLINLTMLKTYYTVKEKKTIKESYYQIQKVFQKDTVRKNDVDEIAKTYNYRVLISDGSGTIVYSSEGEKSLMYKSLWNILNENLDKISNQIKKQGYAVMTNTNKSMGTSINLMGYLDGDYTVIISTPMESIQTSARLSGQFTMYVGLILIICGAVAMYLYSRQFTRPIEDMAKAANQMSHLDFDVKVPTGSDDELGRLGASINELSSKLEFTISELKTANNELQKDIEQKVQIDEMRKEFIANVSHDFRSPLTSIKGYLEAILDGTIPPEMYEKYLSRVISETERLHKLTESMLTLNSLDAKGFLSRTNFDINRVIKDTAASFEGTCDSRHIRFDLTFSDNIQMVYADMGKIQQVLYNLIDNAIKFSHDDSVIYIQASSKYEKIFVSVKDTGIGIPRDSIKKIWDRFYKTDLSRGKDKRGTGLGLSIVKEIIQAHGENIDVISTEGVGTEFIFSLPSSTSL